MVLFSGPIIGMCVFGRVERRHAYTNNYTYVPWWLQKSTSCEEGINEKQQSSNVCCVLHYKQQANKACFKQTPKQLQITLAFKGHFVLYPESHLYRNAVRFDVPFLILKRRNFLFKLFAFRALICLTELCKNSVLDIQVYIRLTFDMYV